MRPTLKTPPTGQLVEMAALKQHVIAPSSDDDALLAIYLAAAVRRLDGYSGILGRCLLTQIWAVKHACWQSRIGLPFCDVSSVDVTYLDTNGDVQSVPEAHFEIVEGSRFAWLHFKDGFDAPGLFADTVTPVAIDITAGYGVAADVPEPIVTAVLLLAAHLYLNREASVVGASVAPLPFGFDELIAPYRMVGI